MQNSVKAIYNKQKRLALDYTRLRHELSIDVCTMLDLDEAIQQRTTNLALASNGTMPRMSYTTSPVTMHSDKTALVLSPSFEMIGSITAHGKAQLERDQETNAS